MRTTTPVQVRFNDIDMARHAHNAVYLSWFEQARMDFLKLFIEQHHDWRKNGLILARNEVDYRTPVHLGDKVEVECWCTHVGNKSFELAYALFIVTADARKLGAQGRSVMVCFDYNTNATIVVPEEWRTVLTRMRED